MAIRTYDIDDVKITNLRGRTEGHFYDCKSKRISPKKLSKTICALGNADGGEVFVGIEDPDKGWAWNGFENEEAANSHLDIFERLFPFGSGFRYSFIQSVNQPGLLLHIEIEKSPTILRASDGEIYLRRGAQDLKLTTKDEVDRLELNKGVRTHEDQLIKIDIEDIENPLSINEFMVRVIPDTEPKDWLLKQKLIIDTLTTVAGIVIFCDEPQVYLPKVAVKIYRYSTSEPEGSRETMEFDPITIEGSAYNMIYSAVEKVRSIVENIHIVGQAGIEKVQYPTVAIHEIITNAILHRDFSIQDDVHIRVFDDRIEVQSPGTLPGIVTVENILKERSVRNPKLFRIMNKFPNPPNKDVGEGLNTSFRAMRDLKLKDPIIVQNENSVLVVLKHEKLGSAEEAIIEFLSQNDEINNSKAREICHIGDANVMKRVFQKMMKAGIIQTVPGRSRAKTGYVKGSNFPE